MTKTRVDDSTLITFTNRGEAALDELATVLTAHCSHTPEGIVRVLDEVMHTPLDDLAAALSAIVDATSRRNLSLREPAEVEQIDAHNHGGPKPRSTGGRALFQPSGSEQPSGVSRR
jgi:hypothetical protein